MQAPAGGEEPRVLACYRCQAHGPPSCNRYRKSRKLGPCSCPICEEHKLTIDGYCHACGCFPDSCDLSAHLDEFETHHHHPEEPDAQEEANP